MLEDVTSTGLTKLFDNGVLGVVLVLVIVAFAYRERYWQRREERAETKFAEDIKAERASHDKTRDALVDEVRSNERALALVQGQMTNFQAAVDALLKMARREE